MQQSGKASRLRRLGEGIEVDKGYFGAQPFVVPEVRVPDQPPVQDEAILSQWGFARARRSLDPVALLGAGGLELALNMKEEVRLARAVAQGDTTGSKWWQPGSTCSIRSRTRRLMQR